MRTCARSFNKSREKTHYNLGGTRSEARDAECKRDVNLWVDRENSRYAEVTIPAVRWSEDRRDEQIKLAASLVEPEHRSKRSCRFASNSTSSRGEQQRLVGYCCGEAQPCSNPSRPSRRPCCMIAHWNAGERRQQRYQLLSAR